MIHLPASVRVYLCLTPCDMRKSFDSLQALVREHLELDAFAGHLAPKARGMGGNSFGGWRQLLSCRGGALEFVAEVLKVFRADL
jgi:IS66 Orf2 like protein